MSVRLPTFEDSHCQLMTACGEIVSQDAQLLKWLKKQKSLDARYRGAGRSAYVHAGFGGSSGRHVHIDVAPREFFRRSPPKTKNSIAEVRKVLAKTEGHQINVHVDGLYVVQESNCSAIIQATRLKIQEGDVSIATTGGRLAVEGAPIYQIVWRLRKNRDEVEIRLRARTSSIIGPSYLEDCFALLESAFQAFVLGE